MTHINLNSLPSLPLAERGKLPAYPGVYLILDGKGRVAYVGKSTNLYERWQYGHHRYKQAQEMSGARLAWLEVDAPEQLEAVEQRCIEQFAPWLNGTESPKKQLPIRLPAELRARLDAEAARLELSLNAVIIMYLDRVVPQLGGERPAPAPPPARPAPAAAHDEGVADFD